MNAILSQRKVALLFNPRAGKGRAGALAHRIFNEVEQKMGKIDLISDPWPQDLSSYTEAWLCGGDGTLNAFINQYSSLAIPFAVFKGGSGNDFAWQLYREKTVGEYLQSVLSGSPVKVDAGICNGRLFLNGAGIGFDGEVVKAMGVKRFFSAGHIAYLTVVLKKIFSYREKEMRMEAESQQRRGKYFMLAIANGSRYGGGFMIAPGADVSDGWFNIVLIKKVAPLRRIFLLPKVEKGKHLHLPEIEFFREKKIVVYATDLLTAHLDGELMESMRFNIEILPGKFLMYT